MSKRRSKDLFADLEPYRVYAFSDIGLDGNNSSERSVFHRANKHVVKIGKGKFYINPDIDDGSKKEFLHVVGHDRSVLKRGSIKASSIYMSKSIFWSNNKGYIPIKNAIAAVIENGSIDDINNLRYRLGDHKVVEVLLNHFNLEEPKYKRIAYVLGV